jgi:hypothetical protein
MTIDKDTLFKQTPTQSNPYDAKATDFTVEADDLPPFHGQHGENQNEYKQLLKANDPGKSPFGKKA